MALSLAKLTRTNNKVLVQGFDAINLVRKGAPAILQQQIARFPSSKHYEPKFRELRRKKFLKINLPDYQKLRTERDLPADEARMNMKKEGRLPPRTFQERPINISCTTSIFEPFVPPEGDGKSSMLSTEGAKDRLTALQMKGKSRLELRKIRKYEEGFDIKEFAHTAQDILLQAQNLLQNVEENEDQLHDLVTEKAYPEMTFGLWNKTLRWKFIESVEPPRSVHVRTTDMLSKTNIYAQITVRMHTRQILALYDRFGKLMYGSEHLIKDVLEYVVFESHIADTYGQWRIHGKIIPDWMPPREPLLKTYRKPVFEEIPDEEEINKDQKPEEITPDSSGPSLAAA
ncbi:hypothetical protein SNE40_010257 [Patella caerulea]|uniref:Large ribosomal subunit protein mL45 n=1 Tax=Patella caerulea TaxID=87958 RepID=A0AAN8JQ67_PATCE